MRSNRRRGIDEPGHAHELTFTCYHGDRFRSAERVSGWWARAIESARTKHDFSMWALVFMPERVHNQVNEF